jgi:alkaline phosphatase D
MLPRLKRRPYNPDKAFHHGLHHDHHPARRAQRSDPTQVPAHFQRFLGLGASLALVGPAVLAAPAVVSSGRPNTPDGIQLGDPSDDGLVVWARAERQSRMVVEYAAEPGFRNPMRISGPLATSEADFTARTVLTGLLPGQQYHVRVAFENPEQRRGMGAWMEGSFRTPSQQADRPIRFVWSGDTVGQGWGINPDLGGMRIYEAMRQRNPDFFIHSGDTIYADSPITAEQKAEDGRIWRNLVTEEVSKVAETLKEFRGRHRYNMMDTNVRRFASQVPQIWQWDDHEITNNWSDSKDLSATRATRKRRARAGGARQPRLPGKRADALAPPGAGRARASQDRLRTAARRVRARHAQLPRPKWL